MDDLIKSACPFCGSKDIRFMGYPGMYTNSHCECKDCNTIGPAVFVDDEKAATEAWNRRAVPQADAEQDAPIHGYLHIITFETGETTKVVSEFESHPWGRKGTDFSSEFGHEVVPLVAASKTTPSSGEGGNGDH